MSPDPVPPTQAISAADQTLLDELNKAIRRNDKLRSELETNTALTDAEKTAAQNEMDANVRRTNTLLAQRFPRLFGSLMPPQPPQ